MPAEAAAGAILLVGCGKMGGAWLRNVVANRLFSRMCVIEPSAPPPDMQNLAGVTWVRGFQELDPAFMPDIVILAVKPQTMAEALPPYARFTQAVFLSIAAGTSIGRLAALLQNPAASIVRCMPNLPASIGQGMAVAVASAYVTAAQREACDRLLRATGEVAWIDDESRLDAVTALSGSGPAYVFALVEAMAKAGESLGLPAGLSAQLARQTVIGSGALLAATQQSAAELRRAVTSPHGTTEAALKPLLAEPNGIDGLLREAMAAAAQRSRELAR